MFDIGNARKLSITRYVALVIVLVNAALNLLGYETIPEDAGDKISAALVIIVGLYVGFKNNYLTKRGKRQAEALAARNLLKK